MIERQRLSMEQDLATARRALHRALETAERGAYYELEDQLQLANMLLAAILNSVIRGRSDEGALESLRAYLYSLPSHDGSSSAGQPVRSRQA